MLQQQTKPETLPSEADRKSACPVLAPTLKLTQNGTLIQELSLDRPQVLIGRSNDNDISIPTPYVSKHHAILVRSGDSLLLVDLNSANGTYVNSKRVYRHVLQHNDVITVDRRSFFVTYRIEYSEPPAIADSRQEEVEPEDLDIEKLVAGFENLLIGGDTDLLPELSEDVPTIVGVIDDR